MRAAAVLVAAFLAASSSQAAEVRLLSAGAVKPGVDAVIALFQGRTGNTVRVVYNTAPQLQARLASGETPEVLVAPPAVVSSLEPRLAATPAPLGKVGVGVAVKKGAARPDIATVAALKASLLAAKGVVYNRASTGTYVEGALKKLGVHGEIAARTQRPADGEGVLQALAAGSGGEIGFAATTEILLAAGRGEPVELVGPLPAEIQNETTYVAARFPAASAEATAFYALLTGPDGKALLTQKGVR